MRPNPPPGWGAAPPAGHPATIAVGGGGTGTNGATTTEATYTVPAGRRFVGMATMTGELTTALAVGQSASIIVNGFPSGGSNCTIAPPTTATRPASRTPVDSRHILVHLQT